MKPSALAEKKGLEDTLRTIAEQVPRSFAHEVWLMSERNATPEKAANARYVLSVRTDPPTRDDDVVAARAGTLEGTVAIRSLIEDWKLEEAGMRAVMRGIDRDLLVAVGAGRITPDSFVTRGPLADVPTGGERVGGASRTARAQDLVRPHDEGAACPPGSERHVDRTRPLLRGAVERLFATIDVASLSAPSLSVAPDRVGADAIGDVS